MKRFIIILLLAASCHGAVISRVKERERFITYHRDDDIEKYLRDLVIWDENNYSELAGRLNWLIARGDFKNDIHLLGDETKVFWYNGDFYYSFVASGSLAGSFDLIWPTNIGSTGQQLTSMVSGNTATLSWEAPGGVGGLGDVDSVGDALSGATFSADGTGQTLWFEGSTPDDFEVILTSADPVADKTITLPAITGTAIISGHSLTGDVTGTLDTDASTALTIADNVTVTGWALGTSSAAAFTIDGTGTDAVLTMDGTSNAPGTLRYESDNTLFILDQDVQMDAGLTVDTDVLIVDAATDFVNIIGGFTVSQVDTTKTAWSIDTAVSAARLVGLRVGGVPAFELRRAATGPTFLGIGDVLGRFLYGAWNGSGYTQTAEIVAEAPTAHTGAADLPTELVFKTTPDGSGSRAEAMRIKEDKTVLGAGAIEATTTLTSGTGTVVGSILSVGQSAEINANSVSNAGLGLHGWITGAGSAGRKGGLIKWYIEDDGGGGDSIAGHNFASITDFVLSSSTQTGGTDFGNFAVNFTTGVITLKNGATIDNNDDAAAIKYSSQKHKFANPGAANIQIKMENNAGEVVAFNMVNAGVTGLRIMQGAEQDVSVYANSTTGETKDFKVYGFKSGDSLRSLEIGVGVDAADTASFDGLSNYWFDGSIEATADLTVDTDTLFVNSTTHRVGIGTTTPSYILDIDAGEIGDNNYDGLRIVDTGWDMVSHPMLEFYNSNVLFNGSLARIYGEIGILGENSKLYFAVADSSKILQDRMVIDKGGNIGIGLTTVDDNYKLIVRRAADINLGIGLQSSELAIAAFNDAISANIPMRFYASEFNLLNGSVGINTDTPDTKLQVVGTAGFGDDSGNETLFSATGVQTMAGTARVLISFDLEPSLATRPTANPPGEGIADGFATHDFNATTDESVYFHLELAHNYADAGTIHVHFDFFVDVAEAGATSVVWGVEYKKQSIGDNFGFTLGAETIGYTQTSVTLGTPANDKKTHQSAEVSLTTTGFVAGDYILLRLFRDADGTGGTDDFPRDARVIDYHIEYLSDKLGEAI